MTRTIVIGLGNPLLSDDGVGLAVARELRSALTCDPIEVRELHTGGLALMEACAGYDRALLVDAMTAGGRPGTIYHATLEELPLARHTACAHDASLAAALEIGRFLRMPLPHTITVWGVEPADVTTCSEALTAEVARAVPAVVAEIVASLEPACRDGGAS